ncbi:MAG: hypothetical protein CMJ34_09345 [Phycisphaerae bacterium]|nr:hypothetical protein [Phycisphaerae bacterium]
MVKLSRRFLLGAIPGLVLLPGIDPPVQPGRWTDAAAPRVAVAAATPAKARDALTLIGGFTDRLEATASVQVRDSRRGWLPVGTSLLEPRAESIVVPLDEDRLLVIGGWSGQLPNQRRWSRTAEICEPHRPDRRRETSPPFGGSNRSLEGVAATRMSDGRVLAVLDDRLAIFDPEQESWTTGSGPVASRRGARLLALGPRNPEDHIDSVLVVGGHEPGRPSIEIIDIHRNGPPTAETWSDDPLPAVRDVALARSGRSEVIVVGGLIGRRSTPLTWRLDLGNRTVGAGPKLADPDGVTGARLIPRGSRFLLLGGESRTPGGPRPTRGMVLHPASNRVILLPESPHPAVRAMVSADSGGYLVTGGYRFDASASVGSRTSVLETADLLTIPTIAVAD